MSQNPLDSLYQEALLDEVQYPQHKQLLAAPDLKHHERNASCGDAVTVTLTLSDDKNPDKQTITDIGWDGTGCIISQAACSVVSDAMIGKTVTEVQAMDEAEVLDLLGLQEIAYGRKKCLLLCVQAVQGALKHHLQK